MTDFELVKDMIERAQARGEMKCDRPLEIKEDSTGNSIHVYAGYYGFVAIFSFNSDGSLDGIAAYE